MNKNGCIILHPHRQNMRIPISPRSQSSTEKRSCFYSGIEGTEVDWLAAHGPFTVYVPITKALSSKFMVKSEKLLLYESFSLGKIFVWVKVLHQRDTFDYITFLPAIT